MFQKISRLFLIASLLLLPGVTYAQTISGYQHQIDALNSRISRTQGTLHGISNKADTLQNKVDGLNAEIHQLQDRIDLANLKIEQTNKRITLLKAQLEAQKQIMFENARVLYKTGQRTTIETLFSSDSFSEFIAQQESLERVKSAVNEAAQSVIALTNDLQDKLKQLKQYLIDQKAQKQAIAVKRDEQAHLLAVTRGQESRYQSIVRANKAQVARLEAAQAAALSRLIGSGGTSQTGGAITYKNLWGSQPQCGGGYSYCNYAHDQWVPDDWGLHLARECVHYAAWAVASHGYYIPYNVFAGRGNANQWESTLSGVARVDNNPHGAQVVYMPIGGLGHVAYVESVNGGWVHVSQYNFDANVSGNYSEMDLQVTPNLRFFHFSK